MARKGYGRNSTLVNITTHADDGTSPVGSNEWNENPKTDGVFGLAKATESVSSYSIDITDSYVEVTSSGNEEIRTMVQTTDVLTPANYGASHSDGSGTDGANSTIKSFAEGDLLYLVKANASHVITLKHQYGGSGGAGKITTLTGGDLLLDVKVPRIFMCRTISGVQEWVEYGGGTASDLDTTNFSLAALVTASDTIASNDNDTTIPTSAAVKDYVDTEISTKDNTDEITEGATNLYYTEARVNANSAVAANTLKTGITTAQANEISANTTLLDVIAGTATASKALVIDSNKDLTGVRNLTVDGDLTVSGTTTTVNVEDLTVDTADITIMNGNTTAAAADDSGIKTQIGASSFKTLLWKHATSAWTSSDNIDSTEYKIAGTTVLSGSTLGSTITGSSLTSVGTLTGLTLTGALSGTDVALSGRLKTDKGADVASATAMTLGADGNIFDITGTTTIVTIPSTNWAAGNLIHLQFDGVLTVTHSSATDSILLGDQANMTTAAGDVLSLFFNGTNWVEVSRSSVSSGGAAHVTQEWTATTAPSNPSTGTGIMYMKTIDSNNEGLFMKMRKNNQVVEVQIA